VAYQTPILKALQPTNHVLCILEAWNESLKKVYVFNLKIMKTPPRSLINRGTTSHITARYFSTSTFPKLKSLIENNTICAQLL
jgi:hypothetical protein